MTRQTRVNAETVSVPTQQFIEHHGLVRCYKIIPGKDIDILALSLKRDNEAMSPTMEDTIFEYTDEGLEKAKQSLYQLWLHRVYNNYLHWLDRYKDSQFFKDRFRKKVNKKTSQEFQDIDSNVCYYRNLLNTSYASYCDSRLQYTPLPEKLTVVPTISIGDTVYELRIGSMILDDEGLFLTPVKIANISIEDKRFENINDSDEVDFSIGLLTENNTFLNPEVVSADCPERAPLVIPDKAVFYSYRAAEKAKNQIIQRLVQQLFDEKMEESGQQRVGKNCQ